MQKNDNNNTRSKISRKRFVKQLAAGLGGAAFYPFLSREIPINEATVRNSRPNIVFICSDQHSYKYTGYAGHNYVRTPSLDRIARQGVVFNNAYSGSPVCVPGRTCMMTGMFPSDSNSFGNTTVWDGSNPTWGTRLQRAGYETWATGKLDLNNNFDIGFIQIDASSQHSNIPDITELFRQPLIYRIDERPQVTGKPRNQRDRHDPQMLANALKYLQNKKSGTDQPWAAYIGFSEPHPGFTALDRYYHWYYPDRVDMPNILPGHLEDLHLMFQRLRCFKCIATPIPEERIRKARAGYFGLITELDEYIGQVWDALEKTGQLDNTIFVYTSDHGEMLGDHGLWFKNNLYEGASHVPLILAGAGLPKGKQIDTPVSHVDLIYTLLEWAGAARPDTLRGHSLIPMIQGKGLGNHPGYAYAESHSEGNCTGSFMIRKGDWKYLHFTWYDDLLFNLADDPGEFTNKIADPSTKDIQKELKDILHALVDPEEVTIRGFQMQQGFLDNIVHHLNSDELLDKLKGRLGLGQAKALVNKLSIIK